jgi:DNA-binding XRE family transcriptional regulator
MKNSNITTWTELKDQIYGEKGTLRRDKLDREFKSLKIGLMLREAREKKKLTQDQLGQIIEKKRSYISRIENDASNITLKTLYEIVEKGLGGKVKIQIEI